MKPNLLGSLEQPDHHGGFVNFDFFRDRAGKLWLVWDYDRVYEVPPDHANHILRTLVGFMAHREPAAVFEARLLDGLTPCGRLGEDGNRRIRQVLDTLKVELI